MEIRIIDRSRVGLLIGFAYYPADHEEDKNEFNIYLLLICLSIRYE